MAHTLFLFPIASLLIIAMWAFYDTKQYHAFKKWVSKTASKVWALFTNVCERVNEDHELF
jgi:hypothetical protein